MKSSTSTILVSENIGRVSSITLSPKNAKAIIVLAHGAGAGMTHRFLNDLATHLTSFSIATIRYNFPYIEKGSRRPDVPAVAEKTVGAVLDYAKEVFPDTPVFLGGKSFGGRMSSQYVSKTNHSWTRGIVFYGFPLHPPGKPDTQRGEHLKNIQVPMLFLQGTNDALATLPLMEKTCKALITASLVKFEGADHSFKVKKTELIPDLALSTSQWIEKILSQKFV